MSWSWKQVPLSSCATRLFQILFQADCNMFHAAGDVMFPTCTFCSQHQMFALQLMQSSCSPFA